MPGQLSPSPPVPPWVSSSPEAMSLTETRRLVPDAHLLHPQVSYMSDVPSPRNMRQAASSTSKTTLPPQQARQPSYNNYYRDLGHPADHGHQGPSAPLSRTLQSHQSASFSPVNSTSFNLCSRVSPEKRLETSSSPFGPFIKKDDSEDSSSLNGVLIAVPPFPYMSGRQAASGYGDPAVGSQVMPDDMSLISDNSGSIDSGSSRSSDNIQYDIIIRQQPVAARACGFGDRDRRVVDPPPILQMLVRDPGTAPKDLDSKPRYPFSVIHCDLWNAEHDYDETAMPEIGEGRQRRLTGTLVASSFVGSDEFNVEGCFFPFPDLSCRTTGRYRLRFVLVVLDPARMKTGDKLPFRATILSNVFEVYLAKTFPGMIPSTELTKRLKDQGYLISVKKGHQKINRATEARGSEDQGNEDATADSPGNGREKHQRT